MITLDSFIETFKDARVRKFLHHFDKDQHNYFSDNYHGDFTKWKKALDHIKEIQPSLQKADDYDINADVIRVGSELNPGQDEIKDALKIFMPWRKGPYNIFGIPVDCEWRSDWKWNRLKDHISALKDRRVLDIGCGNGYHCWRQLANGAHSVFGIDPMLHYVMQFNIFKYYLPFSNIEVLPLGIEQLPTDIFKFDTVFSMGVLYHRRSPIDHLFDLKELLSPDGELILETLVIDGEQGKVLVPEGRYAKMRNVWFIPSVLTLESWLKRCGFKNINVADVNRTSIDEQRITPWMAYESLQQFLDPKDPDKTIEGYPAPKRAILICST
jgi:tRNA (mo5U34)-methyltransferase